VKLAKSEEDEKLRAIKIFSYDQKNIN